MLNNDVFLFLMCSKILHILSLNFKSHYLYDIIMNVSFYEYIQFKERFLLISKNILAYKTNF